MNYTVTIAQPGVCDDKTHPSGTWHPTQPECLSAPTCSSQANPYYYVMLGNEALRRQDTTAAISQFQQAIKLDRKSHEAYFSLAKSHYLVGNTVQAQRYLQQAIRTSVAQDKARYQRKLTALLQ